MLEIEIFMDGHTGMWCVRRKGFDGSSIYFDDYETACNAKGLIENWLELAVTLERGIIRRD
jgi:hypothetical protein